jgi:putative lipoprotein
MINKQQALEKFSLIMILISLCSLAGCASVNNKRYRDSWFGPDKAKHFVVSAAIGGGSSTILKNNGSRDCDAAAGGISISLVIGAGKEYHDKYISKKYWSWKDMFWNLAGGVAGSLAATGCH